MKHFETKQVTKEETRLVRTTCDACGAEEGSDGWPPPKKDNSPPYVSDEVCIEHSITTSWPNTGDGDSRTLTLDICPGCFTGKILPFLRYLGVTRDYVEKDW